MYRRHLTVFLLIFSIMAIISYAYTESAFNELIVGDHVYLGEMEQDGNPDNGDEPISWLVLDTSEEYCLLITDCIIDHRSYDTSTNTAVDWSNSDIRKWMNTDLFNKIFSQSEQKIIVPVQIGENSENINNYTTTDAIFLLSKEEADYYSLANRTTKVIPAAQDNYSPEKDKYHREGWWLRTSYSNAQATITDATSKVYKMSNEFGVRPVIMVTRSTIQPRPIQLPERDEYEYLVARVINKTAPRECMQKIKNLTEIYFSAHYDLAFRAKIKRSAAHTYILVNSGTGESIIFDDQSYAMSQKNYNISIESDISYLNKKNGYEKIDFYTAVDGFFR